MRVPRIRVLWVLPLLFAASLGLAASPAAAQGSASDVVSEGGSSRLHSQAPTAVATATDASIAIDGRLEEEAWAMAEPVTEFTQVDPMEGRPASERTEVRILYDTEALYVGARLFDPAPVTTRLARRDAMVPDSDFFIVLLDSYHDHRTAYRFATNPSGMKRDEVVTGGGGGGGGPGGGRGFGDTSWDPVWEVASAVTDSGWVTEMRIPFSQLRFSPEDVQTWGIQLERKINRKQENAVFAFTPKLERGGVANYGHLRGITGLRPGRRLEILPYVGGRAEYRVIPRDAAVDFSNPFRSGSEFFAGGGVDLKYRLSSNVTLDATVNPDFGQVEVDPAELNITAFETRFEEKRPFFVEGAEIFRFGDAGGGGGRFGPGGSAQLLYSRRIGRSPQGEVPDGAVYSDLPSTTTILGAVKLTGKTAGGWSAGLLNGVTGREQAPFVDERGFQREAVVEPLSNYLVGRLRKDLRAGQTNLGAIVTAVNRNLDDPELEGLLRSGAYVLGGDFRHEWADRSWALSGQIASSYVAGSEEAIIRTQRSSARYFQRPDAEYLGVDSSATSLSGLRTEVELQKQAGEWQGGATVSSISPGFEANDLGFQTAADRLQLETSLRYEQPRPGKVFRRWDLSSDVDVTWNHGREVVDASLGLFGSAQFSNYWGTFFRLGYDPSTLNDRLTRGGPLARDPSGYSAFLNLSSDNRKAYSLRAGVNLGWDEAGAWRRSANINMGLKPNDRWEVRVGPDIALSRSAAQFVTSVSDLVAERTFGRRYIFAPLEQTTIGIETRLNVTFNPELSLEVFAQPFLSSGDYGDLKELREPRTFDFLEYGADLGTVSRNSEGDYVVDPDGPGAGAPFRVADRDFTFRSLRGNAVLRWEWRPGSTVYLVWQQERSETLTALATDPAYRQVGNFHFGRDSRELFGLRPDNVFLIKVNYWLNP